MISAANPYASETGFDILKKGGSAIDAAIAVEREILGLIGWRASRIGRLKTSNNLNFVCNSLFYKCHNFLLYSVTKRTHEPATIGKVRYQERHTTCVVLMKYRYDIGIRCTTICIEM